MSRKNKVSSNNEKDVILTQKSSFLIKEAYKTLRANVSFGLPGSGCKCIAITSAERGDGKSTIAVNLAISFAQINKKVLVIDCDMRLPTIAKKFGISPDTGLSNYLVDSDTTTDNLIFRIEDHDVDIIPAGNIPPDPTKLLESPQMEETINMVKDYYDYIIFDFPPIALVSDAVILSKYIDGYLLIVKHGHSEMSKISECLKQLEFSNAKILGFVYNWKAETSGKYGIGNKYYKNKYYKNRYYKNSYYK